MITVLQWNCHSLKPKLDLFKFLSHNSDCDVFALCETWLSSEDELNFHDFNIIRQDRDDHYGGVLLGIKKCYSFYRIPIPTHPGVEIVACQINVKGKDLCVASVYIPPGISINRRHLWNAVSMLSHPVLILGDMNSHGTGWGEPYDDYRAAIFYDLCDDFNLNVLNTGEVTRIASDGKESRLDLSLGSSALSFDCLWKVIEDPHGSDHLPIITSIKLNCERSEQPIPVPFDLTRNIDWQKYAAAVSFGIESFDPLPPLDEYRFLSELIYKSALESQRQRVPSATFKRKPATPGWDNDCTQLYLKKSDAFKAFRRHGTSELYQEYAKLERKLKNLLKAKKRSYWRHFIEGLSRETSMTVLWRVARNMRNRSSTNESDEYSNRWIFNFAKKVCPDSVPAEPPFWETPLRDGSLDRPFSMLEFSIALLSSNNSAPGRDMIKFNLLKNLPDIAKRRLLDLFNSFMENNIVPLEWRQVKVIAIQKPGKPASDHNSYRPIAMLSCLRKLLEKMILSRLDHWVESNNLLSNTQFGFRKGKGTNDCLALLSSDIQLAFAEKEQLASVFLDIKVT